jgi:hypothetical protein
MTADNFMSLSMLIGFSAYFVFVFLLLQLPACARDWVRPDKRPRDCTYEQLSGGRCEIEHAQNVKRYYRLPMPCVWQKLCPRSGP